VSYDLAIWVGRRPWTKRAASKEFERRTAYLESEDVELAPPSAPLAAFLRELLERFPALDEREDPRSPWAVGPEPGDVNGDFAYLNMTYSGAEIAADEVAALARRHGLVCFDPQTEALEPHGASVTEVAFWTCG
jgi:hypothetical protein